MAKAKKSDVDLYHVICKLPHASSEISGVAFVPHPDVDGAVRTAEPVKSDVVDKFDGIPGFDIVEAEPPKKPKTAPAAPLAPVADVAAPPVGDKQPAAPPENQSDEQTDELKF